MKRMIPSRMKTTAALALACSAALVFAVAAVQARPAHTAGSQAATVAVSDCTIVVSGAPWRIRAGVPSGSLAGDKYTLKARRISCSSVRTWVTRFTNQRNPGIGQTLKGPRGFTCTSLTTPASGAKLVVAGVCAHPPHNVPFFGWGPKVPGH
jgi:hypothetical protein